MRALALLTLALATAATAAPATSGAAPQPAAVPQPPTAPTATEAMLAADAAVFAPPDMKRQLVKHRARLMQGVADAAREGAPRDPAARAASATALARRIARDVRQHARFSEVAWDAGVLVHACAAIGGLPARPPAKASFLGFPPDPFRDPAALLAVPEGTDRWDAAVTRATRLLAFAWKEAGGDAGLALRTPQTKGPYPVRE